VRESAQFRELLTLALRIGNFINHGLEDGDTGARGFDLASLASLATFKTGAVSTLHFLCLTLWQSNQGWLKEFRSGLQHVHEAARLQVAQLGTSIDLFRADIDFARRETAHLEEDSEAHRRLKALVDMLDAEEKELSTSKAQALEQCTEVQKFFSISEQAAAKLQPAEDFFKNIANFVDAFSQVWEEIEKKPAKWQQFAESAKKGASGAPSQEQPPADGAPIPGVAEPGGPPTKPVRRRSCTRPSLRRAASLESAEGDERKVASAATAPRAVTPEGGREACDEAFVQPAHAEEQQPPAEGAPAEPPKD